MTEREWREREIAEERQQGIAARKFTEEEAKEIGELADFAADFILKEMANAEKE